MYMYMRRVVLYQQMTIPSANKFILNTIDVQRPQYKLDHSQQQMAFVAASALLVRWRIKCVIAFKYDVMLVKERH